MFAAKNTTTSPSPSSITNKGANAFIQPKLSVGKPGDKYEVEADKAADQIVAKSNEPSAPFFPATPTIQKQSEEDLQKQEAQETEIQQQPVVDGITTGIQLKEDNTIQKTEEEEVQQQEESGQEELQMMTEEASVEQMPEPTLQTKETSDVTPALPNVQQTANEDVQRMEEEEIQEKEEEEVQMLQKQASGDEGNTASIENDLNASKGGGSPLDSNTKSEMESGFGTDFSGVRVHNDSTAVQMNQQLGSQAFANGNDIYFNEGKYNPGSDSGKHLLAHELTHTVQQGASVQTKMIQKAGEEPATELGAPTTVVDITNGLNLSKDWLDYIEENPKTKKIDVSVKIGAQYTGTITLKKLGKVKEGEKQKFELAGSKTGRHLDVHGMQFLNPLQQAEIYPILVLNNFGEEQKTSGFLSIKKKEVAVTKNAVGIIDGINENLEAMSFLGLSPIKGTQGLENKFESGGLHFKANDLSVGIDGYIEASGSIGITNSAFTFELSSTVDVAGLASGEFNLSRGEDGKLSGKANISADIANVNANLVIEYDKGAVTIQGTGKMNSEKFSGEITLLVTDAAKSKQMMNAALGVETMDAEAAAPAPATPKEAVPKTKGNQVLAGWGEVKATITPWLEGTAKIGIDSEGHVTIVGEIVVPNEIELMEQRGKKVDIFSIEIRAGYGIPLVGQVFLFASVGMFVNAGFGPLVLKNVGFTGTYSTDPSVLQQFSITGTLGINAFAIIGLEAEAGVGVTLLGHDLKAGVNVTAAAGLRAYAEATPTFQYEESASPQGGKIGESRLKGHFEAAAQLFLQLSGALFYELDSPWWSPAPDGREEFPLGEVQYPIGDSMGIGADIDWLVGSPDAPELTFSPVEFDPDKFTADVMADPPPKKMGKADAAPAGEWKGEPGGEQGKDPKVTGDGKGLPENSKKKEDLKKLPDEQKYMRSLDEMSKLEKAKPKPSYAVVQAKADKVKKKYGLDKIQLKDKQDDSVSVFVKHAKEDNGKHLLKVPLMSEAERLLLLHSAMTDLRTREKKATGEDGTMQESGAKDMITTWLKAHPVVESAKVIDGKETWDYFIDIGDKSETEKGKPKKGDENAKSTIGKEVKFKIGKENHRLWITFKGSKAILMMASKEGPIKEQEEIQDGSEEANKINSVANTIESTATSLNTAVESGAKTPEQAEKEDNAIEQKEDQIPDLVKAIEEREDVTGDDEKYFKIIVESALVKPVKQNESKIQDPDSKQTYPIHSTGEADKGTWKSGATKKGLTDAGLKGFSGKISEILQSMLDKKLVSNIKGNSRVYTIVSGGPGYKKEVEAVNARAAATDSIKSLRIAFKYGSLSGLSKAEILATISDVVISDDEYTSLIAGGNSDFESIAITNSDKITGSKLTTLRSNIRVAIAKKYKDSIDNLRSNVIENGNLSPSQYRKLIGNTFEDWITIKFKEEGITGKDVPYIPSDNGAFKLKPDAYMPEKSRVVEIKSGSSGPSGNDITQMGKYNTYLGDTVWIKKSNPTTEVTFEFVRYILEKDKYLNWVDHFRTNIDAKKVEVYHLKDKKKSLGEKWPGKSK